MVPLKGNCKQALFCVTEYIPYTWVTLSPMKTKEPGGANKDTTTLGNFSSSGTFQPATSNFPPVCKVLLKPADGTQTFEKGKNGIFPSPSLSWQEVYCIYIFPTPAFLNTTPTSACFYYKKK